MKNIKTSIIHSSQVIIFSILIFPLIGWFLGKNTPHLKYYILAGFFISIFVLMFELMKIAKILSGEKK